MYGFSMDSKQSYLILSYLSTPWLLSVVLFISIVMESSE